MIYRSLFHIIEGLSKDIKKIIDVINKMENEANETNEKLESKSVILGHNGNILIYEIRDGDVLFEGRIPFGDIYNATKGKDIFEYDGIISELIENDVIKKRF